MKKPFDRFTLTELIAQGPGGALYHGQERLPGGVVRPVRVKIMPAPSRADPNVEARFVEEVRVLAALAGNPYVVTFYGAGVAEDGAPWVAMEPAAATLASLIGPSPAPAADVARLVEHVARGLAALHGLAAPRLHNRLSPGNVLAFEGGRHFKVTEFGLALPVTAEPTLSADAARYAAPELLANDAGRPGPASDLYALGHLAYELALGAKLLRGQFPAVADGSTDLAAAGPARWQAWHHSMPTVVRPAHEVVAGFPAGLSAVIAKLMAKPVADRYASAQAVLADLARDLDVAPAAPAGNGSRPTAGVASRVLAGPPPVPRFQDSRTAAAAPAAALANGGAGRRGGRYYLRFRNRTSGPYDVPTLQRMSRQGQVSRLHQVSTDQQSWSAATTIDGLFG